MTTKLDLRATLKLKDEEIARQIAKRKFAEQTRNWVIIFTIALVITLIIVL